MDGLDELDVGTLRQLLVSELGMSHEDAENTKGKVAIREMIRSHRGLSAEELSDALDEVVSVDKQAEVKQSNDIPNYGDENWEEYVLSNFTEEELYEGKFPTLNGLRRVAIKVFGHCIESYPIDLKWNGDSALCLYRLVFFSKDLKTNVVYGAAADATQNNMNGAYCVYPSAIAENRAEARAYRKMLLLKVVTADEIKDANEKYKSVLEETSVSGEYDESAPMSSQQENLIKIKCSQLNINYDDFVADLGPVITRQNAVELINKLNKVGKE